MYTIFFYQKYMRGGLWKSQGEWPLAMIFKMTPALVTSSAWLDHQNEFITMVSKGGQQTINKFGHNCKTTYSKISNRNVGPIQNLWMTVCKGPNTTYPFLLWISQFPVPTLGYQFPVHTCKNYDLHFNISSIFYNSNEPHFPPHSH